MANADSFKKYDHPYVTVDIIVLTILDDILQVALIKRGIEPFKNEWGLPGGFVHIDESVEDAAKRELREELGVENVYLEQLFTFGDVNRDPRARIISVAYFALISPENLKLIASTDATDAKWFPVSKLPVLAFDHQKIAKTAVARVQSKLRYSTIAY